jgi:hypothetical protein
LPVTFTATADDRARGGSDVAAAELFLQTAPPAPSANGQGLPMAPADGGFDGMIEGVSWQDALPAPPGTACVWIHAQDAAGNWGPYASKCFVVINAGPDTVPPALAVPDAVARVNGNVDLSIGWRAAFDDALFGGTTEYHVFRATSPRGPWTLDVSGPVVANGSSNYRFVDPGRAADSLDYFYRIQSIDAAGHRALSSTLAAKVRIAFASGLNLLGMPIRLTDPTFVDVAAGSAWADAWSYDGCASGAGWSSAVPADTASFSLGPGRGFWMNGTTGDNLTALGVVLQTNRIHLCTGWNLIALPGFALGMTAGDLIAATGATSVMGFDASGPYHVRAMSSGDGLLSGAGYWVRVPGAVDWTIPGW